MGNELGYVRALYFNLGVVRMQDFQLINNVPADGALMQLIEKSSASDDELEKNFDIFSICNKKTSKCGAPLR
jgi:hypothetical protein